MNNDTKTPRFAAFAVSLTGNRGAVSMLISAIDHLTNDERAGHMAVFTVYPKTDAAVATQERVSVHNGSPARLVFWLTPLSILYRIVKFLRLPIRRWPRDFQALVDTDVVLAIGGTTFSDAQLVKVIYNVACIFPAIVLGKPIMLYSQTLGPFKQTGNRLLAKWALNKADFLAPRGAGSLKSVEELNPKTPYAHYADAAFTLVIPDEVRQRMNEKYHYLEAHRGRIVGISVNTIVWGKATKAGIDHNRIWADFIQQLRDADYTILMIPHSMRPGKKSSHNNDLLLVDQILDLLPDRDGIHVIDEPYDSKELRVVVGLADYYMASRFHSMISALCEAVPVTVFGWGYHKYWEVLNEFELGDYCWDSFDLTTEKLWSAFECILADRMPMVEKMKANLPTVKASSMQNHEKAWEIYQNQRG